MIRYKINFRFLTDSMKPQTSRKTSEESKFQSANDASSKSNRKTSEESKSQSANKTSSNSNRRGFQACCTAVCTSFLPCGPKRNTEDSRYNFLLEY